MVKLFYTAAERWTLVAAILASSLVFIDGTALNIAMPALQEEMNLTGAQLMWVINAYLFLWLAPSLDKVFSSRDAGTQIAQLIDKGNNVAIHKVRRGIFNFYANNIFHELTEVDAVLFVEESPHNILLIRKQELANLFTQSKFTSAIDTFAIYDIANSTYYLVKKYVGN